MQIRIQKTNLGSPDKDPQWVIIEMQGDLESRLTGDHADPSQGGFIGDLHYNKKPPHAPVLIIGHHILHGKILDLDKPMVAIKKKKDQHEGEGGENCSTRYEVEAIIRKKLLFKARPKPIIANVTKKA